MDLIFSRGTSTAPDGGVSVREELELGVGSNTIALSVGLVSRGETMSLTDLIDGFLDTWDGRLADNKAVEAFDETPLASRAVDDSRSGFEIVAPERSPSIRAADDTLSSAAGCVSRTGVSSSGSGSAFAAAAGPAMPACISSARIPSNRSRKTVLHRANPHSTHRIPLNRGGITFSHPGESHMRLAGFAARLRFLAGGAGAFEEGEAVALLGLGVLADLS